MNVARIRFALWSAGALALAAGGAAVALAIFMPLNAPSTDLPVSAKVASAGPASRPTIGPLSAFEPAWKVPLRRPLIDPAPVKPVAAAARVKPKNLMVRLIGTIVDTDRPRGVFLVGLANIELKSVGEKAGGAEVLKIEENTATLEYDGQTFVLKREKSPFDPTGGGGEPPAARSKTADDDGS